MAAPYSTILLDTATWDITTDAQGNIARADPPYAAAQDMGSQCRQFQGDYIYGADDGVPYDSILGKAPSLGLLKSDFIAAASHVPGTSNVKCFIQSVRDRLVTGQVQANVASTGTVVAAPIGGQTREIPSQSTVSFEAGTDVNSNMSTFTTSPLDTVGPSLLLMQVLTFGGTAISVDSVTDTAGLIWQRRAMVSAVPVAGLFSGGNPVHELWWAISPSAQTGLVATVNLTDVPNVTGASIMSWIGTNPASPFDPNGSLPVTGFVDDAASVPNVSGLNTTGASTTLVAFAVTDSQGAPASGPGFVTVPLTAGPFSIVDRQYRMVATRQPGISISFGAGDLSTNCWLMIADALRPA